MLLSVLLLLLLVSGTKATHFHGTMMTYYPKETYKNGSVSVIFRFKFNFISCGGDTFTCTGNCGVESMILSPTKIDEISGTWCQTEQITSRLLPNNSALQLAFASSGWFTNLNGIVSWRAVGNVELRHRSDTNKPNSSPQTTILPNMRVPSNCYTNINLLAFDPDGDVVQCRYANLSLTECASPCTPPPVLNLSSTCTLYFSKALSSDEGRYAVQMVMEDFPTQSIALTQTDGSQVVKTTSDAISNIPVQFAFQVDPAVTSCTAGYYLPRFLSPTPGHGTKFSIPATLTLEITIQAEATHSVITELLYSGPYDVVKSSPGSGSFILTWTPSESEEGHSQPICFLVQASYNTSVYQSELRCVIVEVEKKPTVSYINVLKMKISTTLSLKDNNNLIENVIKEELIRGGFPPGITVRLLSNESVETTK